MRIPNRVYSYATRYICMIVAVLLLHLAVVNVTASASSADTSAITIDRYDSLPDADSTVSNGVGATVQQVEITKENLDMKQFNGSIMDTIIFIIGALAGFMMMLQITAYSICRVFPSWNDKVAKLKWLGITGYEDSLLFFSIKVGLLGVLSFLCISGVLKDFIRWILGLFSILVS